ncbi:hypothetical protein DESC_600054 [Desulfosarcina cetonica]|uniref:adenylate/guanylate cyclase domain-containing protein n=1 Tax=Desulfosarcina cetonica TaxID=90730 RepID=UPI0006D13E2E|nr:adenylate/guanylate cyclase domain-containing protein [Desulfosarcina cetonica]VTR67340.1 hypothetical protein DESC_600054 [Desulfosarcina cetonica]
MEPKRKISDIKNTAHRPDTPRWPDAAPVTPASAPPEDLFHLPGRAIFGSALFINPALHLVWVRVNPDDKLFGAIRDEFADNPSGTVLDILLRASLKELVFDWQPLFTFIYRFLKDTTPALVFSRLAPVIELPSAAADASASGENRQHPAPPVVDSCPIRIADRDSHVRPMRFYAIAFTEGTLCLYQAAHAHDTRVGEPPAAPGSDVPADPATLKTAFGVLSARIDNSQHIVATLLPETYFHLMRRIWEASDEIVVACGGQRAKRSGTDVQYVIPQQADTDPAFDAIRCAVTLQKRVAEINRSLREEGGWVADIRLNIGISSGRDHLPEGDPSASMAFMLPGGAADQAQHLSAIGQAGTILITKLAFGHLSAAQMDRVTFGTFRNDRLIPRTFAQVADFAAGPDSPSVGQEIRSLFITRIIALKTDPDA